MTLTELYNGCRTYRRFLQKPVPKEVLRAALDNARTASSAANAQPLRYIAVTDPTLVAAIQPLVKWAGCGGTVPLTGFGYALAQGVKEAVAEKGLMGAIVGGLTATAAGITTAVTLGLIAALVGKSGDKA